MTKPFSDPLSAFVPSGPQQSPTGQDRTGHNRTTPKPPQAGAHSDRASRARNGSRRQRDLDALAAENAPPADILPSDDATAAWTQALAELTRTLPRSVIVLWLSRTRLLGEHKRAIALGATSDVTFFLRKRYGRHIGAAVRKQGYKGAFIYELEPERQEAML